MTTGKTFWRRIIVTVCLFVIHSCQNTEHNICSQGEMTDDTITLTLNSIAVNDECCCNLQIMPDIDTVSDPQVMVFLEFSCTITLTKQYNWRSGISCNENGTWTSVRISKTMDICVKRNGMEIQPTKGRLGFKNTDGGHQWTFSISCNGSGSSTPVTSASTVTTATPSLSITTGPAAVKTTAVHNQDKSRQLPVGAVVGVAVAIITVIIVIAVIIYCVHRKRKVKHPPIDDVTARYVVDDLFSEDDEVIVRPNSLYVPSGADNSGYYHKPTVNRSSSAIRIPKKQLFKGDVYSAKQTNPSSNTGSSANTLSDIVSSVDTSPEEATFVY